MPTPIPLPAHPDVPLEEITAANDALGELCVIQAEATRIQAELNAAVAYLVAGAQARVNRAIERVPELESIVTDFAEKHREKLATGRGKTQTIKLPAGDLTWKFTVLSIEVVEEVALADIDRRGWTNRFTEAKRVVVKDRLKETDEALRDARKVKGITVNDPQQVFVIKPSQIKLKTDTKLKTDDNIQTDSDQAGATGAPTQN